MNRRRSDPRASAAEQPEEVEVPEIAHRLPSDEQWLAHFVRGMPQLPGPQRLEVRFAGIR